MIDVMLAPFGYPRKFGTFRPTTPVRNMIMAAGLRALMANRIIY